MRIILMLVLGLFCLACDTKKKLDQTLDNANATITKANMKLDELSDLARDLKSELSDVVRMTGAAASKTIAGLGDRAGGLPDSGGEVKGTDESVDLDEDGTPDAVTAVEYEGQYLWLIDASTLGQLECKTQLYFVTDNPPEEILGWGLIAEGCGTSACAPEELEKDEPDLGNCDCQDPDGAAMDCADLYASLRGGASGGAGSGGSAGSDGDDGGGGGSAGSGSGGSDDEECPSGSEGTPPDCTPISSGGDPTALACLDGSDAVAFEMVCDGTSDCADDSDEACAVVWLCDSGEAVAVASACDGAADCSDSSDEADCSDADWICDDGEEAVTASWLCDGADDCSDGSDEASCALVWLCDDGEEVIGAAGVCDGTSDCGDGSDEARCE